MTNEIYIRRINESRFKILKEQFILFEPGERVLVKKSGIKSLVCTNKAVVVIENKCHFVLGCPESVSGSIRINFGRTSRVLGLYTTHSPPKKLNFGIRSYVEDRTTLFLEENNVLLDSIYFEVMPKDYNTLFLEKSVYNCTKLGITSIFYIFKVLDLDSLLLLSSIVEFLNVVVVVTNNQKVFVILENVIDILEKKVEYLEEVLLLFKDRKVYPVFSIPFHPVKAQMFDTPEEILENLENLKKVFIEEVSFLGNFPYLLACDAGDCSRNLDIRDWKTFITGVNCISECVGSQGVVLYNVPAGHPVGIKEISKFSRKTYREHTETPKDFSNTSGLFFFSKEDLIVSDTVKFVLFGPKNYEEDTECVPCKNNCYISLDENYILESISKTF